MQVDERRLARAGRAEDRDHLPGLGDEVDVAEHRGRVGLAVGAEVGERHVLEGDPALHRAADRLGQRRRVRLGPGRRAPSSSTSRMRPDRRVRRGDLRQQHRQQDERDHHRDQVVEEHEHRAELDRPVDHEVAAHPQRAGQAEVDDQQERRVEQRRRALRGRRGALQARGSRRRSGRSRSRARTNALHDPDAGHVLLQHLVQAVEAGEHRSVQRRTGALVEGEHRDHDRQEHDHHEREPRLDARAGSGSRRRSSAAPAGASSRCSWSRRGPG